MDLDLCWRLEWGSSLPQSSADPSVGLTHTGLGGGVKTFRVRQSHSRQLRDLPGPQLQSLAFWSMCVLCSVGWISVLLSLGSGKGPARAEPEAASLSGSALEVNWEHLSTSPRSPGIPPSLTPTTTRGLAQSCPPFLNEWLLCLASVISKECCSL